LEEFARSIAAHHRPATFDYAARFGLAATDAMAPRSVTAAPEQKRETRIVATPSSATKTELNQGYRCRHCESTALTIAYGKYGYYFKCVTCSGNTPIRTSCGQAAHKERLRKDGRRFYRECAECRTSRLFYENPE
jgi:hypothetical protein